jgi:hypothetical protein
VNDLFATGLLGLALCMLVAAAITVRLRHVLAFAVAPG